MNLSGSVNVLRLFVNPSLCLPHHTIATFDQLPVPLSAAFTNPSSGTAEKNAPEIRAVVLDKDNCFAAPHQLDIYDTYRAKFAELRAAYPGARLLIVSNSSGSASDLDHTEADLLERKTGVAVLRHALCKPSCRAEIMDYFRSRPETGVRVPGQIAVVGDRLFTDVLMANVMGSYSVWIRDGPVPDSGLLSRMEKGLASFLLRRGYNPPEPKSEFE